MQDHDLEAIGVDPIMLPMSNPPDYIAYANMIVEEGVKIVETAGNNIKKAIAVFKKGGCQILHKCTTIKHALSAVKLGVDFLSIDGFECAGHVGETDISNVVLLLQARQQLGDVPFIASGGFADGQGLAGALALGACGINMVEASENGTELILRRWKNTNRLFKNKVTAEATRIERESTTGKFEEVLPLVSGAEREAGFPEWRSGSWGSCHTLFVDVAGNADGYDRSGLLVSALI
ncbi:2-nitropropane dioxygenase [Lecanosticta acicola]|uniref:2-nitropropane dioxygenase n=1 Tax=Lecanosticta acicola TaxID=111012 RepID=A0AAI8Z8V7_9PEZI|nr:2-nitropropane dioxygenase [Lecanosticta acicola]